MRLTPLRSIVSAAVTLLLVAVGTWFFLAHDRGAPITYAHPAASRGETTAPADLRRSETESAPESSPRARVEEVEEAASLAPHDPREREGGETAPRIVHGRVTNLSGIGMIGLGVGFMPERQGAALDRYPVLAADEIVTTSGARGHFELAVARERGLVIAQDERWMTVLAGRIRPADSEEVSIVVAERLPLAGIVVDGNHAPITGAELGVYLPDSIVEDAGALPDHSRELLLHARSESDGSFTLPFVPRCPGSGLQARAAGHRWTFVTLPPEGSTDLVVEMIALGPDDLIVAGRVEDARGAPIAQAHVSAGGAVQRTDESGAFVLDLREPMLEYMRPDGPLEVIALHPGHLPVRHKLPPREQMPEQDREEYLVLRLVGSPLAIAGRVVDEEGGAIRGVIVELAEDTPFGLVRLEGTEGYISASVESLCMGNRSSGVSTSSHGSFEIRGLLDRSYSLIAREPETLRAVETDPIAAGDRGVEIVLPSDSLGTIRGRVVTLDGGPLRDVQVMLARDLGAKGSVGPAPPRTTGRASRTDDAGRFALPDVATDGVYLGVRGDELIPVTRFPLADEPNLDDVTIVVTRRCSFRVDWSTIPTADRITFLASDGTPLTLYQFGPGSWRTQEGIGRPGPTDRAETFVLPETAAHAVLFRDGEEIDRVSITLFPGEVIELRF